MGEKVILIHISMAKWSLLTLSFNQMVGDLNLTLTHVEYLVVNHLSLTGRPAIRGLIGTIVNNG